MNEEAIPPPPHPRRHPIAPHLFPSPPAFPPLGCVAFLAFGTMQHSLLAQTGLANAPYCRVVAGSRRPILFRAPAGHRASPLPHNHGLRSLEPTRAAAVSVLGVSRQRFSG